MILPEEEKINPADLMQDPLPEMDVPIEGVEEIPIEELDNAIPEQEISDIDPDELASALWSLVRDYERDDEDAHGRFMNEALKGEKYWANEQHIYFDSTAGIFQAANDSPDGSQDYEVNIYRANGESIIAAMSASLPKITFYPDDAENPDDVTTAEAYLRIATLLQKHNKAPLLLIRALCILYNQHFVAAYNYNDKSFKYGFYEVEEKQQVPITSIQSVCPNCGSPVQTESQLCMECGMPYSAPETFEQTDMVEQVVGITKEPKTRELLHVFGPMNVKIAPYVQELYDSPYLILKFERHPSLARNLFADIREKLEKSSAANTDEGIDERRYRAELYRGEHDHLDTWTMVWIRPWAFDRWDVNERYAPYFKENYPKGVSAIFVNGVLTDIKDEDLDDHWTITQNPLASYIYSEPIGKSGIPVQDATNELVNLSMETVKHGIPQTFADSQTLNFSEYKKSTISPGMVFPVQKPSGGGVGDGFFTTRTSTLSQEVKDLGEKLQQFGQLVTGAFPSIYGGVVQGSRTASEYAQSRAQALQRLATTWTMVKQFWADTLGKACTEYANNLAHDEKEVIKQGDSFVNVWIRKAQLNGRIGKIEPEIDEQLPTSLSQQRDVLMRLIELNSPDINPVLLMPENSTLVKTALGIKELKVPGHDDRMKQLHEIQEMLQSGPIDQITPSIPIDETLDNHEIEATVCRDFLISEVGRDLRNTNPPAYANIYLHFMAHNQVVQMRLAQAMMMQEQSQGNENASRRDSGNRSTGTE